MTAEERRAKLLERKEKLQARISELTSTQRERDRKTRDRRCLILGAEIEKIVGAQGKEATSKVAELIERASPPKPQVIDSELEHLIRIGAMVEKAIGTTDEALIEKVLKKATAPQVDREQKSVGSIFERLLTSVKG